MKSYYQELMVSPHATLTEIKKAYHRLASVHHPDKGGTVHQFEIIKKAYDILKDPKKRAEYDMTLKTKLSSRISRPSPVAPGKETREEELKRIFHDPNYTQHHYFTPRYRKSEESERAKRAEQKRCPICHGRGFVRYNVRPELGSIGIEERLCSCQIVSP